MKELPHSIESEQSVIWWIITDWNLINSTLLTENDFYEPIYQKIFKIFLSLKKHRKNIDIIIVSDFIKSHWLEKQISLVDLMELSESWNSYNFSNYEKIVKEKSNRRTMIQYAREVENIAYSESQEMEDVLNKVENISEYVFDIKPKESIWDTISYVNSFEEMRDKVNTRNWMLWDKSLYPIVDTYTKWIIEWKVYTLVAYSNVWKSKMSYTYVADMLKQGKKVMYISLEVDKAMLFSNLLSSYYNKEYHEVLKEDFYYDMSEFENLEIYDDIYKLDEIKTMIKTKSPDIVFIDFIQNIQTAWNSETEKMTKVAQELQQLAITTWITLFNLSQANNESRFKGWEAIQPKWSWAIFASSDVIFAMSREWKDLYFTIAKNKYWKAQKRFLCEPNRTYSQFKIVEEVEEQNNEFKL